MKKFTVGLCALLTALSITSIATAETVVSSTSEKIQPDLIDQVIRVEDQQTPGSSHLKVSIVVLDGGMSTDVSPRYTVYLTLSSLAEMGNMGATFKITNKAYQFKSARKISDKLFEVSFVEYRDQMYDVILTIDAAKLFADELMARKDCGEDFCDIDLESSVDVTESATLIP